MRRLILPAILALALVLGSTAPASAAPDHSVPSADSYAICEYIRVGAGYTGFEVLNWRTFHYGTAHVTQCDMRDVWPIIGYHICYQHVWGTPGFDVYWSGFAWCW